MDSYSRFIAVLKVLLPLAALAILATLFLLSRSIDPSATIPFAENDMADRLRDQQVTAPFFSGTTPNGDEIIVTASAARPAMLGRPAGADNISARLTLADGGRITLDADTGQVDVTTDTASFAGDVRIATSTGYILRTDELRAALTGINGEAPGTVNGTAPFGTITAGAMSFAAKNGEGPIHIVFKNRVKLVYRPKQQER